ncbi:hypothetical protein DFH11DRAFT_451284 [Phellopilus nigrolimitatus]|nr:hypothetical protein DFH11DRAFT_451284 [Phellopilus nigrolimitatus]
MPRADAKTTWGRWGPAHRAPGSSRCARARQCSCLPARHRRAEEKADLKEERSRDANLATRRVASPRRSSDAAKPAPLCPVCSSAPPPQTPSRRKTSAHNQAGPGRAQMAMGMSGTSEHPRADAPPASVCILVQKQRAAAASAPSAGARARGVHRWRKGSRNGAQVCGCIVLETVVFSAKDVEQCCNTACSASNLPPASCQATHTMLDTSPVAVCAICTLANLSVHEFAQAHSLYKTHRWQPFSPQRQKQGEHLTDLRRSAALIRICFVPGQRTCRL